QYPEFFQHPFRNVKPESFIRLSGQNTVDASTVNNALLWKLSTKQDLDRELIDENAERAQTGNLLGVDNRYNLTYYHLNKGFLRKDSLHWFVQYGFVDHGGVSYSGDFFKLIGQGNAVFQGDTAFAGGLDFRRSRFDHLSFGVMYFFPNRSNVSFSIGPARGMRFIDVQSPKFRVYTAPYGTETEWDVDVTARLTPGDRQTMAFNNGNGAQLSFDFQGLVSPEGAYAFGVHNFGFMQWRGSEFTKDTAFSYDGWNIPDFDEFTRPDAGRNAYDSIAGAFLPDSNGFNSMAWLPAYLYASYTMKFRERGAFTFKFDKVMFSPMLPRVTVGYTHFFKKLYSTTTVSTGGYSRFSLNQSFGFRWGNHAVQVQLFGVHAWPLPHRLSGLGAGVSYAWILKRKQG
ncbi:MAG: hypothetical protein LPK45_03140, partial [Bacteroidota bacterium]|nr:hypothetical protein [Bacteroidota bacterium]MDX5430039.1 hypothetical protein [Bacteroidota bacterium]MDX5468809.1 hypothetical protein [Bacteroidota bacterium]